jgi:hypothetical protein
LTKKNAAGSCKSDQRLKKNVLLQIESVFKDIDGIQEAAFSYCHNHVDGVEVFPALETSRQIGILICGGMKAVTQRTSEAEHFGFVLHLKFQQINNKGIDVYIIPQFAKKLPRVMFRHDCTSSMAGKTLTWFRLRGVP